MYSNAIMAAVAIKTPGHIVREIEGAVRLPFGTEYSVLISNGRSLRMRCQVAIDGESVMGDNWLVIAPYGQVELSRYIRNGNLNKGNRFKFVERSRAVEDWRGKRPEDGEVTVRFYVEEPPVVKRSWFVVPYNPVQYSDRHLYTTVNTTTSMSAACCGTGTPASAGSLASAQSGITVPGSVSNQRFSTVWNFPAAYAGAITVVLRGSHKAIFVDSRIRCQTCGKSHKEGVDKYCSRCGTALRIV